MAGYEKYPLPSHAAHIWHAADQLWLGLPSPAEGARGHTTHFPVDEAALRNLLADTERCSLDERKAIASLLALVSTLKARSAEATQRQAPKRHKGVEGSMIGSLGAPTQAQLEALTKGLRVQRIEPLKKKEAPAELTLADLGL